MRLGNQWRFIVTAGIVSLAEKTINEEQSNRLTFREGDQLEGWGMGGDDGWMVSFVNKRATDVWLN